MITKYIFHLDFPVELRQKSYGYVLYHTILLLVAQLVKNPPAMWRPGFDPWVGKISWRRKWRPTPVFLPGKLHGQRSLMGYSPWNHKSWTWLSTQPRTRILGWKPLSLRLSKALLNCLLASSVVIGKSGVILMSDSYIHLFMHSFIIFHSTSISGTISSPPMCQPLF